MKKLCEEFLRGFKDLLGSSQAVKIRDYFGWTTACSFPVIWIMSELVGFFVRPLRGSETTALLIYVYVVSSLLAFVGIILLPIGLTLQKMIKVRASRLKRRVVHPRPEEVEQRIFEEPFVVYPSPKRPVRGRPFLGLP